MTYRNALTALFNPHDHQISVLATLYRSRGFTVYANPSSSKIMPIRVNGALVYPDVVVSTLDAIRLIIEVETAESVNVSQALQWKRYAASGYPFHLYVPHASIRTALALLQNCYNVTVYGY